MNYGTMPLPVNKNLIIHAGSYLYRPVWAVGIKLAREIKAAAEAHVDLFDMSAPEDTFTEWQMRGALLLAIYSLSRQQAVYVGCMGGYGRTGIFLALLVKCLGYEGDPVDYVRENYHPRAVETRDQEAYVDQFDPGALGVAIAGARVRGGWGSKKSEIAYASGGYAG